MKLKKNIIICAKWISICILIGVFSGSASALFLVLLEWVTRFRGNNNWIICLLPLGGLVVGLLYHCYGTAVVKGNNLLLEEYEKPQKGIPLKMVPLVLVGTLITHFFGGSAGREGTAVQMGGAIADQFKIFLGLNHSTRKTLIILGISAGFASVFGTPLAGAIFALEVVYFSKITTRSILLSFITAYIAYFTVETWQVKHNQYFIPSVPELSISNFCWILAAGILFGLTAMLFSRNTHLWEKIFSKYIKYAPFRPFFGGIFLASAIYFIGNTKYIGLGIPTIIEAFNTTNQWYDFLFKILFTGFTIGAGFKGGEVTPLFFVGATLGSALSTIIPLPTAILAGMGFVAVFSGATHTPIACTIMGLELFGIESGVYIGTSCFVAFYSSGLTGIYKSQVIRGSKYWVYQKFRKNNIKIL